MKAGDKIYDKARGRYGVVLSFNTTLTTSAARAIYDAGGDLTPFIREVRYQPYQNGTPVGQPTIAEVTQLILLLWSVWEPLTQMIATVRDWLTPDPVRVAARIEARRIRKEAKKHLPQ